MCIEFDSKNWLHSDRVNDNQKHRSLPIWLQNKRRIRTERDWHFYGQAPGISWWTSIIIYLIETKNQVV